MATTVAAQTSRNLLNSSPFLTPIAVTACWYKNVIQERCAHTLKAYRPSVVACNSDVSYTGLSISTSLQISAAGTPFSHISSTSSDQETSNPRRQRSLVPLRAASKETFSFRIPAVKEKPEWWWRTLACIPYLIALQISDVGYYLQPFSQHYELFENLIFYVPGAITRLPSWFTLMYCYLAYCWVVKNKDWPLFFRFHLMMGMLLETGLQICWYTFNFMPLIHYNGKFGMQFWAAMGFAYITVLLQCVRAAISRSFIHIPFVSEAAFIHSLFHIGGYHRPF
ncbi:hypothetical protein Dsin_007122 [Dipteronia sinensis]|uniref:Protein TIC 20 n=1 Tax=Dipteronia sinensis TaxID=43782 RepID=A0AAE0EI45_9ROSI|nr:hypothetical protein Dsin_007122 [Dipteronia sinensis]